MPDERPAQRTIAYTDGSCLGNPGPGGWGVHAELPDGRVLELGGGETDTTNNRMELRAAIEALRLTADSPAVTIITDSAYVQRGVTRWLKLWAANGWRTARGQPVENQPLWRELAARLDDRVTWQWTRAHVGTAGNERADQIARSFAQAIRPLRQPRRTREPLRPDAALRTPSPGVAYLSLVDGILARHATWADCQARVNGVRGARFKKIRNADEERATIDGWGLTSEELEYV